MFYLQIRKKYFHILSQIINHLISQSKEEKYEILLGEGSTAPIVAQLISACYNLRDNKWPATLYICVAVITVIVVTVIYYYMNHYYFNIIIYLYAIYLYALAIIIFVFHAKKATLTETETNYLPGREWML